MATSLAFLNALARGRSDHPAEPSDTTVRAVATDEGRDEAAIRRRGEQAASLGDWPAAEKIWRQIYDRNRSDRAALLGSVSALQSMGRLDEADSLLGEAAPEHAEHADYAIVFALIAQLRMDLPEAVRRTMRIVERFPEHAYGYGSAAVLLTASDREEEAFEVLSRGMAQFPDDETFIVPSIRVAVARRDWLTAAMELDRLDARLADDHPGRRDVEGFRDVIRSGRAAVAHDQGLEAEGKRDFRLALEAWRTHCSLVGPTRENLLGTGRCHREIGSFTQAEQAFAEATELVGRDAEIESNVAQVAAVAGDWPEAARRWLEVIGRYPQITAFVGLAAPALARAGRLEEAETLVGDAVDREPDLIDPLVTHATIAEIAGDWRTAVNRWSRVVARAPDQPGFGMLREEARKRLDACNEAGTPGGASGETEIVFDEHDEDIPPMSELVKQFESLGDNCEFGVVQRHFGAEPITLFRFAAIEPEQMIRLLETNLEPLGDPEHTHVYEMLDEYYIRDDRGYYYMHTFVKTGQVDPERYMKQQVPRIAYLKRNFLTDVKACERIYVCKHSTSQISDETLHRLSACLRRFGDNILLGGRRADDRHPAGTTTRLTDNILIGYTTQLHGEEDRPENSRSWGLVLKKVFQERRRQLSRLRADAAD